MIVCAIFILVTFSKKLNLDTDRFRFLTGLFSGSIDSEVLNYDTRQDTWARFYDSIIDSPIFGNGYSAFLTSLTDVNAQGVHNTFLLIFGESGFLPFLLFLSLIIRLLYSTFTSRGHNIDIFFLTLLLFITFLVSHNFFSSGIQIFIIALIIYRITQENYIKTI